MTKQRFWFAATGADGEGFDIGEGDKVIGHADTREDARLFAVSPYLLRVCKAIRDGIKAGDETPAVDLLLLDTAITLATGEESK